MARQLGPWSVMIRYKRADLFRGDRDHEAIERVLGKVLSGQYPSIAFPPNGLDPAGKSHAEPFCHGPYRRIHPGSTDPGIRSTRFPTGSDSIALPGFDLTGKRRIADGEILRSVVELDRDAANLQAPGRHAATGPAPLVEERNPVTSVPQAGCARKAGHAGTDYGNMHR